MIQEAIILAGGKGTRLVSEIGKEIPKPMADIDGKPFLEHLLNHLEQFNVSEIILSVGYQQQVIIDHFGNKYKTLNITYAPENEPLGTGGAILNAMQHVNEKEVFVINGDTFFDVDLTKLYHFHLKTEAGLTMALKPMKEFDRYGTVEIYDNRIVGFSEKQYQKTGLINGGIYIANAKLMRAIPFPQKFSFETDFLETNYQRYHFFGYVADQYFIDIGIPKDYMRAKTDLKTR